MDKKNILSRLNDRLKELMIPPLSTLPDVSLEVSSLKGKRVVMVDDSPSVIARYFPFLMVASDGSVSLIFHTKETKSELVGQIKSLQPDLVLLDANLNRGVKGYDIVPALKDSGFKIIGFSTDPCTEKYFLENGAQGFVWKTVHNVEEAIKEISRLV